MSTSNEYMIYSKFRQLLPNHRHSHAGYDARKLGLDPTLSTLEDFIEYRVQLKRLVQKNVANLEQTAANLNKASTLKIHVEHQKLGKIRQEIVQDSIEVRALAQLHIQQLDQVQEHLHKRALETMAHIQKDLRACAKKNLKLSETQLDPIFACEDVHDLERYLDSQGMQRDQFCDMTKISEKNLLDPSTRGQSFCEALLLLAWLGSQGPFSEMSDPKAIKKKLKKNKESVLPCMAHYDRAIASLDADVAAIVQEIQPKKIKNTVAQLSQLNAKLDNIDQQVAGKVKIAEANLALEKQAKTQHKNRYIVTKTTIKSDQNDQSHFAPSNTFEPD